MQIDVHDTPQAVTIKVVGDLDETAERPIAGLRSKVKASGKTLVFDLERLGLINSIGAKHWMTLVRELDREHELQFVNCPVTFVGYALMLASMTGRGKLHSFFAPYSCATCRTQRSMLLNARDLSGNRIPDQRCPKCAETMTLELDDGEDLFTILAV